MDDGYVSFRHSSVLYVTIRIMENRLGREHASACTHVRLYDLRADSVTVNRQASFVVVTPQYCRVQLSRNYSFVTSRFFLIVSFLPCRCNSQVLVQPKSVGSRTRERLHARARIRPTCRQRDGQPTGVVCRRHAPVLSRATVP